MTPAVQTNSDLAALLRARHTLLWITTREEVRVERALINVAADTRFPIRFWDCATGITDATGTSVNNLQDPGAALAFIRDKPERCLYVLRDLHKWFDPIILRSLRSLARSLQTAPPDNARALVLLTPSNEVPLELAGQTTVLDYPLPDRTEIASLLDDILTALPDDLRELAAPNGTRDAAIDAAVGLSAEEAGNCYARSLVTTRTIDPVLVTSEKRRVIAREKVLTWHDPDPRGLDAIGGLEALKSWLLTRQAAFTPRARAFGLPAPKGALLVGVPGCGKSLTAKCIASTWRMPLLRLDMGALRSKYVGESEANIRKALQVAETVAPCVLWLDEIEKALGSTTQPQGDGGVAADALGAVLSWMQDRAASVFIVATANDVRALPPELLRKGRFDELFFIDLPTHIERESILRATLNQYRREDPLDIQALGRATQGFTGSEISALVPEALFTAFADNERAITTEDLLAAARSVTPLSRTASEQLDALRAWAKGRARPASLAVTQDASNSTRTLDLA